ncbi:hypothetical protein AGMMS50267_08020 [Spirochaetia bacterium]|nr:hypothetical protein AGMMS50267_08020 [Spirochaetia bacterium]
MKVDTQRYFEAVSLGAFFFSNEAKATRFAALLKELTTRRLVLHFLLITICLNFPVMFAIAKIAPYEVFSRLYGEDFLVVQPDGTASINPDGPAADSLNSFTNADENTFMADNFNALMIQNGYGRKIMLPLLGMAFVLVLILQAAFYASAAFYIGLQRLTGTALSMKERLGILLFSSTLPVFLVAILGLWLPTVHILVFYLTVIVIGFQKNKVALRAANDL